MVLTSSELPAAAQKVVAEPSADVPLIALLAGASAAIFALDAFAPRAVAVPVAYVLVVFWAYARLPVRWATGVTASCAALTVLAAACLALNGGPHVWEWTINRALALVALIVTDAVSRRWRWREQSSAAWQAKLYAAVQQKTQDLSDAHETLQHLSEERLRAEKTAGDTVVLYREAELALRESLARKRAIFDAAPDGMLIVDQSGRVAEFNPAAERVFGYQRDEIIGQDLADSLLAPESRPVQHDCLARLAQATNGSAPLAQRFEAAAMHKSRGPFLAEITLQAIPLQGTPAFVVFLRDITERKLAEQAVRNSEALYHSLVDHLPISLARKDIAGRFTFGNRAFLKLMNRTSDELYGRTDFDLFPPDLAAKYREDDARVVAEGALFDDVETHRSAEGEVTFVQVLKTPVYDHENRVVGTQMLFWDVTDRQRAEQELERSSLALQQRHRELQESAEAVRTKNRELEILLHVTSHDLREPLRAIENFSRILHERYRDRLDAKGQDFLWRVMRGAQRLDHLLEDVLTLSRAQRTVHADDRVPGTEIVADALRQLDHTIEVTGARVTVARELPCLRVDRRWATQAVFNLLSNALKFTLPGQAPQIEVYTYEPRAGEPPGVGLVVCDRGPGVAPEYTERIFQLFQRAVGREVEGTGAGLAIVRQIAESHGGAAWVRNRAGGGSEFVITLGA